jgi:nucleotide-binding universal stress UspA family protein
MTKILIALDDSDASARAAVAARRLFADGEMLAINVATVTVPWADSLGWGMVGPYPVIPTPAYEGEHLEDLQRQAEERAVRTAAGTAHDAGIASVEPIAATGDVADAIVHAAHDHHVDVIVVG